MISQRQIILFLLEIPFEEYFEHLAAIFVYDSDIDDNRQFDFCSLKLCRNSVDSVDWKPLKILSD